VPPVDTHTGGEHLGSVSKKPHKIGEPKATYAAKKPVKAVPAPKKDQPQQIRYVDREIARKLTKDILDKHHALFRKLAQ
jgi:hypothetical protein